METRSQAQADAVISYGKIIGKTSRDEETGEYKVVSNAWKDTGEFSVFLVKALRTHPKYPDLHGYPLEAQAFRKHNALPRKLYECRKRRIRRLRNSHNFVDDFEDQAGVRIIVCYCPREGIARHRKQKGSMGPLRTEPLFDVRDSDFPTLGTGRDGTVAGGFDMGKSTLSYARVVGQPC